MTSDQQRDEAERLRLAISEDAFVETTLSTNDRVIARVTDGIYRQPGSALRELIANAYDADASWVVVNTDAPRFSRITIEDDGAGMSPESVVHLLHNIGGSAKRTEQGQALGIASIADQNLSPGGRELIGKLGIGIFSVSQLTHSFQIVTKTAGDNHRTVVLVNLRQFSEQTVDQSDAAFEAGTVRMWRESTQDLAAHGTTIVLNAIRPQTRDTLRSEQLWSAIDSVIPESDSRAKALTSIPAFHIGRMDPTGDKLSGNRTIRNLPWDESDDPETCFRKMVDAVWTTRGGANVRLSEIFDTYLQTLWNLALALPLPYVEKNVLDESVSDEWAYFYKVSNEPRGAAVKLETTDPTLTPRELGGLSAPTPALDFRVVVDGVSLRRPLKFRGLPTTQHALKRPLVFVGSLLQTFEGLPLDVTAGPLEFDAYLFWTARVVPADHQGVLVRIHDASGTLFDSTFLGYQVAEITRLRQITCEVFVRQGLEAALNIDRESFNTAHPHTVVLTRWLHGALRQLATTQKREAQSVRHSAHAEAQAAASSVTRTIIEAANELRTEGEGVLPDIYFTPSPEPSPLDEISYNFSIDELLEAVPNLHSINMNRAVNEQFRAIVQLLAVYGVFDGLADKERHNLVGSILAILEAGDA